MVFKKSMQPKSAFPVFCAVILPIVLGSCATSNQLVAKARGFSITDIRPAKVEVVEVREKDLKALPTGEERALAYQRSGRRFFGLLGPVNFKEPDLPAGGEPMDGGLLLSLD